MEAGDKVEETIHKSSTPNITKMGTEINRGISALVYCDPGGGKTTMAARLPKDETLIINVEAGLGPLLGTGHSCFQLSKDLRDLTGIYKYLLTEDHPFKYVVLDNISELQEWFVLALTGMRKKDFAEIREHGDAMNKMRETLYNFRNLIEKNINVIFNAWEMSLEVEKTQDGIKTKLYPKLYKNLAPEVCGIVDMVGHLERYEKTEDRFVRFEGSEKLIAKSQYRGLDKFEPADWTYIFKKVRAWNYKKEKPIKITSKEEVQLIKGGN